MMKKVVLFFLLFLVVMGVAGSSGFNVADFFKHNSGSREKITDYYEQRINALDSFLMSYPDYFFDSTLTVRKKKYNELAYRIKEIGGFMTYFEPETFHDNIAGPFHLTTVKRKGVFTNLPDNFVLTGPLGIGLTDAEVKNAAPGDLAEERQFIMEAAKNYRRVLNSFDYRKHFKDMTESDLFDALRTEINRITIIDLANADFIIDTAALPALNGSVHSWIKNVGVLVDNLQGNGGQLRVRWSRLSARTSLYLKENTDFMHFNRMDFSQDCLIPLSVFLFELQHQSGIPFKQKLSAIRSDARHIYDKEVFNPDFFAPEDKGHWSAEKEELGKILFFDPILSGNNKRSCASCHKPGLAFTDGRKKGLAFNFNSLLRNTPTVINSGFQKDQLWDLRTASLEGQMDTVLNTPDELHSDFRSLIIKLQASPEYLQRFSKAFPQSKKGRIGKEDVKSAIAVYQRSLTAMNSRFDKHMRGEKGALSQSAINGFNLYMGKAKCGVCHFSPLFNGTVPPFFDKSDHHSTGVTMQDTMKKYRIDPDRGKFVHSHDALDQFSFKTPSLRNIELTAPYMHNGTHQTLQRVIDFYNNAGGSFFRKDLRPELSAAGLPPVPLTLLPVPLELTENEKKELVDFLKSLTDTSSIGRIPNRLPRLKGKYYKLNSRKPGGEY
jgi:cytochrome c peroxidase